MASADVLTPITAVSRSRRIENINGTPSYDIVSPATKRRGGLGGPTSYLPSDAMNDDQAEQQERMKSRIAQLHQKGLASPATQSERRVSLSVGNLSSTQLSEHYANCIKLSAENKISAKNAFGLHLIDYMGELLRKQDNISFQVASSTLDASAKIYAGRVDAIHSETFKILGNLGHGSDIKQTDNEGDEEGVSRADGEIGTEETNAVEKKRKRAKKSKTIETNLRNINMAGTEADCEASNLSLHKAWAAFDDDHSSTLLMAHLHCYDDSCVLTLDSNGTVKLVNQNLAANCGKEDMVNLGEYTKLLNSQRLAELKICPTYSDFHFTNWNKEKDNNESFHENGNASLNKTQTLSAPPGEVILNYDDDDDDNFELNDLPADGFQNVPDNDDDDNNANADEESTAVQADVKITNSKESQLIDLVVQDIRQGKVDKLMQIIASEPSDYSYFNCPLLNTWAGPQHWKVKALRKEAVTDATNTKKATKRTKEVFMIDHKDDSEDLESHLKKTRAATCLSKAATNKYDKSRCLLPEDLHYNIDDLCRLFHRPDVLLRKQIPNSAALCDDIDRVRDSQHDHSYFCPPISSQDGDTVITSTTDTGHDGDSDDELGGVDFHFEADDVSETLPEAGFLQQTGDGVVEALLNGTLAGENLIAAPRKVEQIDIAYAKTAKRIDVKKLKTAMWGIVNKQTENVNDKLSLVSSPSSFASVLQRLSKTLPGNMVSNLSVPIAFVCLLHIANEKNLFISSTEQFSDLNICVEQ